MPVFLWGFLTFEYFFAAHKWRNEQPVGLNVNITSPPVKSLEVLILFPVSTRRHLWCRDTLHRMWVLAPMRPVASLYVTLSAPPRDCVEPESCWQKPMACVGGSLNLWFSKEWKICRGNSHCCGHSQEILKPTFVLYFLPVHKYMPTHIHLEVVFW
jgi:hypothetical protein